MKLSPDQLDRTAAALAPLGEIAVQVRERLDGSGYPRRLPGGTISRPARLLGAAAALFAVQHGLLPEGRPT